MGKPTANTVLCPTPNKWFTILDGVPHTDRPTLANASPCIFHFPLEKGPRCGPFSFSCRTEKKARDGGPTAFAS